MSLTIQHHIASLEVTIEKSLCIIGIGQVFSKQAEVGLELQFMEINLSGLQKTVFEIVQVKEHRIAIKRRLWITVGKIEAIGTRHLNTRQLTYGAT